MSFHLTCQQQEEYRKKGYLVLRASEHRLLPDPQVLPIWSDQVRQWPLEKGKWMPYFELNDQGERQIMRTENFKDYHEGFEALLCSEGLRNVLKQCSGDEMLLFKDKINYKLPHGGGFAPHIDAPAYDHIGKIEHVTANIAIHAATPANGCLEVVPGSHKMQVELAEGGKISDKWVEEHEWLSVPLDVGDILIFGSHLAHRSGPNTTASPRAMLYATYHGKSDGDDLREKYYAHRRIAFPPDHERQAGVDYEAGWKTYAFAAPFAPLSAASAVSASS